MCTITAALVCFLFLQSIVEVRGFGELAYSFRRPQKWGELTPETADCCPLLAYPQNITSEEKFLPHFVGIGTVKSGSTSLADYLNSNPDFAISKWKETYFMVTDLKATQSMKDYENLWDRTNANGKVRFEFTPCYLWVSTGLKQKLFYGGLGPNRALSDEENSTKYEICSHTEESS